MLLFNVEVDFVLLLMLEILLNNRDLRLRVKRNR